MTNVLMLDQQAHGDLRVGQGASRAESWKGFVELVVGEFAMAAASFPLFFAKNDETGRFVTGMLHGIRSDAEQPGRKGPDPDDYLPFALRREGFYAVGDHIGVDMDDPRIGRADGRRLFDEQGQPTDELRAVQHAIFALKNGRGDTDAFIDAMLRHELVEPVDISLRFDDGERLNFAGLYTPSLDELRSLPDEAALRLFRDGHLQLAYCMTGSLLQLHALARRRNRALTEGPGGDASG